MFPLQVGSYVQNGTTQRCIPRCRPILGHYAVMMQIHVTVPAVSRPIHVDF